MKFNHLYIGKTKTNKQNQVNFCILSGATIKVFTNCYYTNRKLNNQKWVGTKPER